MAQNWSLYVQNTKNVCLKWWLIDSCQWRWWFSHDHIWSHQYYFQTLFQVCCFASILLFIQMCLKFLSKNAENLEICFSRKMNCDKILTDISFEKSLSSDRHSVSVFIGTSYFLICFDYWRCFNLKAINVSSSC